MNAAGDFSATLEISQGILLVDDDPNVLRSVGQMLNSLGCSPLYQAASTVEALEFWRLHRDEIALLVSDFIMPNLTGDHLALRMTRDRPALKVLFISGNDPMSLDSAIPLQPGQNYLQKPFRLVDLRAAIQNIQNLASSEGTTPPQRL